MAIAFGGIRTITSAAETQLTASTILTPHFIIQALTANTDYIYVGVTGVSSTNYIIALSPGQILDWFDQWGVPTNLSTIYMIAAVNNEKSAWSYETRF